MKSLSDLQAVLGGLQRQINDCVEYIDQVTTQLTGGRRKAPRAKLNGASLRERVKQHYEAQRGTQSDDTITVTDAAKLLKMSEAGVRFKIHNGSLDARREVRATRKTGVGSVPHPVTVVNRAAVETLAESIRQNVKPRLGRKPSRKTTGKTKTSSHQSRIGRQRQASADFLDRFHHEEPKMVRDRRIGALVRRGYLVKKGDGYIRSEKEFTVKKGAASAQ